MADVVAKGSGEVERTADRAQLWVTYGASAVDRRDAVTELNRRLATVEPQLAGEGVEVRSRRVSVHASWEEGRQVGSRAEQAYQLRVADPRMLEGVLAILIAAEPAALNGPDWELVDDAEAVCEAQRLAVADARRRAEGYAAALGGRLGPLLRIVDGDDGHSSGYFGRASGTMEMSADSTPDVRELNLVPDQVITTVTCTATWSLLD